MMTIGRVLNARSRMAAVAVAAIRVPVVNALRAYSSDPMIRYRAKLEEKAKKERVSSVDELKAKLKHEIEKKRVEFNKIDPLQVLEKVTGGKEPLDSVARAPYKTPGVPKSDIKDLGSYVDVSKLSLHEPKEIELIWKARFAEKDNAFCGSLNGITFSMLYRNARKNPIFVLPLPHDDSGVELHFVQWSFAGQNTVHCMITTLVEYKLHQDFARPHTTLSFHSDFLSDKQLVLMNAVVEKDSSLTLQEAVFLSMNLQRFYSADTSSASGQRKLKLLEAFNSGSEEFSTDLLIQETETLD
jgi:ATP synthase F1 complex assembly factor 1